VGEVFFTEAVYLAMNKAEVPSAEVGYLQLKGVPEKIRVYRVRREEPLEGEELREPVLLEEKGVKAWAAPAQAPSRAARWQWSFLALIALAAAGEGLWLSRKRAGALPDDPGHPCREEAGRLCAGVPQAGGQKAACLRRHLSELSPVCAQAPWLSKAPLPLPKVPWNPGDVDKELTARVSAACGQDVRGLCGGVEKGEGRIFNCLWTRWDELSAPCRTASAPLLRKASPKR
jgi:hypothetical protein